MPPGADGLQHNGTDWICGCKENWSGTPCETDALAFTGGDKDNYLLLGECEVIETFIPREAAFMGVDGIGISADNQTVFDTSKSEQQTENWHVHCRVSIGSMTGVKWCNLKLKKIRKSAIINRSQRDITDLTMGSESTCTIGNVATGWLSRNYNDLAIGEKRERLRIERYLSRHSSPPTHPSPPRQYPIAHQ